MASVGRVDDETERPDANASAPVLRWRDGLRYQALASSIGLLLLPIAVMLAAWNVADQGYRIGLDLVQPERATVVSTEYNSGGSSNCAGVWIHVRSRSGKGKFRVCEDNRLADLDVGDTLIVHPHLFTDEVGPEGEPVDWLSTLLVPIGLLIGVASARTLLDLRRLTTTGPQGPRFHCTVTELRRNGRSATLKVVGENRSLRVQQPSRHPPRRSRFVLGDADVWAVRARPPRLGTSRQWVIVQADHRHVVAGTMTSLAPSQT